MRPRIVIPVGLVFALGDLLAWLKVNVGCGLAEDPDNKAAICSSDVAVHVPLIGAVAIAACAFLAWDSNRGWILGLGMLIATATALPALLAS